MGRGKNPTETLAETLVTLRGARGADSDSLRRALQEASEVLEQALAQTPHFSKAEAAHLLDVTAPTLDKWIAAGLLPTESVAEYKRQRIPAKPLLDLASEVKELRRMGQKRGLLKEALSRLEQQDPEWRREFDRLYGPAFAARAAGDELVSAAPGADWSPND